MAGGSCVFAAADIARGRSPGTRNRPGWPNTPAALRVTGNALIGRRVLGERCVQISPRDEFDLCVDGTTLVLAPPAACALLPRNRARARGCCGERYRLAPRSTLAATA